MTVIKYEFLFPLSFHFDVQKAEHKELMLFNCGVGEDSGESLDCTEIQPVHSEGDQPWDFFGRNDAKAEAPVLWPSCKELTDWKRL